MHEIPEQDRAALMAVLNQALRDESQTEQPPRAEQGDWLCGSSELSEPDENGWMTFVPTETRWVPRALLFWRMAAESSAALTGEHMRDPRHSLVRWLSVQEAVRRTFGMVGSVMTW